MQKQIQVHWRHRSYECAPEAGCAIEQQMFAERAQRIKLNEEVELCLETIDEAVDPPIDG